jgi:anaerobic ribonucleoside-triphosphate reductase activating protein
MDALDKPWISGLTLSGGDPLNHNNIDVVARIVGCVKYNFPNKNIWCYTGYTLEELWARANYDKHLDYILRHIDILVDGKYIEDLRDISYPWAGSSNQRIWANVNGEWVQSEYDKEYRERLNAKSITRISEQK